MTTPIAEERALRTDPGRGDQASLRTWLRLLACTNLVEREVRGRLRDRFDTTLPRFDVLAQLDAVSRESDSPLTMSELSRRLMVSNGNLTALVERLVQEGSVNRDTSPDDRRTQIVSLTAAGKKSLDMMTPEHQQWIAALFSGMSPGDRKTLFELLGKLKSSVQDSLGEERET